MRAQQTDEVRDPHSGRESFAADIAEREHQTIARLFNAHEIARQVTHSKDLSRNIERAVTHTTRRAQATMNLRRFENRSVQLSVISL
jgi:hypothetical protein